MNDTTSTPHIAPEWASAFILELRLLDVSGTRIGQALADVEAHCADSGESAQDAFGDPVAYAHDLGLPRNGSTFSTGELLGHGAGLVGMFLTVFGIGAWAQHATVPVTSGLALSIILVLAALTAMLRNPEKLMRAVVGRPWLLMVGNIVVVAVVVALLLTLDGSFLDLSPLPVVLLGLLLVAYATLKALRSRGLETDELVRGPEGEHGVGSMEVGRGLTLLARLGPWITAIGTVTLGLLAALPRLF